MSRTYAQPGEILTYINGGDSAINAGSTVLVGIVLAVALVDIPPGESGSVSIEGVHNVPKVAGTAWSQGDRLDWDSSEEAFGKGIEEEEGDVLGCAIAAAAAGSAATTGEVILTPGCGVAGEDTPPPHTDE